MLATKGVTVLAISFDANPPAVLVEGPDGWHEVCPIKKWFKNGDPPQEVHSHLLADIATFECLGVDEHGEAAMSRYDVKLQGIGDPLVRHADGSFGEAAGRRLADRLERAPAQLPAVFDKEGMS
jgi:hypothetical protein